LFASLQQGRLDLRWFGAVGCTGALALAAVLPSVLGISAALAFTVVFPFAGMLGERGGLGLADQQETGVGGG